MKLSVMIITYNHERFIAQAIQSVLDQRVDFDYEIVIGEDCSTDGTRQIVADFHRRYSERIIPLFPKKNLGMMRNFIDTLSACQGQYVAFLEGDDYWASTDKLQRQVDFLDSHPDFVISCGKVQVLDDTATESSQVLPPTKAGTYTIRDLLEANFIYTCTSVCRWGLLDGLPRWLTGLNLGDWPLHALIAQFGKIALADDVLAVYRVHSGGVWSSRSQTSRLQEAARMLEALNRELDYRYNLTIRRTLAVTHFDSAKLAMQNGSRIKTAKYLVDCLQHRGYSSLVDRRPSLKGLVWYVLLGSWHPALARLKRSILRVLTF